MTTPQRTSQALTPRELELLLQRHGWSSSTPLTPAQFDHLVATTGSISLAWEVARYTDELAAKQQEVQQ